jgi:hypothetical protein
MVAHLFRKVTVFLVEPNILERLALRGAMIRRKKNREDKKLTSMGLNGFAIRPIVDE